MKDIDVKELKELFDRGHDFVLLDVRQDYEYEAFNLGGKLIPLGDLAQRIDEVSDNKDKEIVVHCRSGVRSASAKSLLESSGFKNVRNLIGGVLAWQDAGYQIPNR